MVKHILKILMPFLIIGGSSCADNDYFQYYNYFYINNTKYNFEKIVVYANQQSAEYQIKSGDTLKFYFDENSKIPLLINCYVDSVYFYYNNTLKKTTNHNSIGHIVPMWEYMYVSEGKHDQINNDYYIFEDVYFE